MNATNPPSAPVIATVTAPVPPPTAGELATALLASDNILRDIRLSYTDGHLAERAAYHMSHISRATAANHLLFCGQCRQKAHATTADLDARDRQPAPAYTPWPLGINSTMDAHAADLGLSHWSCWSPQDNRLWVRRDGRVHECFRTVPQANYPDELRAIDARLPMGPAARISFPAGGIRVDRPAGVKAHAEAHAEMTDRLNAENTAKLLREAYSHGITTTSIDLPAAPDTDPAPHSRAEDYELTGSPDTMAGLAMILRAMNAEIPDADITDIHMARAALLEALQVGHRLHQRIVAGAMLDFALRGRPGRRVSAAVHRLDLAMALLRTAAGQSASAAV